MPFPPTPALTTDCVVFDERGYVLLIRRKNEPFGGSYALPGGFVDVGEQVEDACRRELSEETGLQVGELRLVGVYSDPKRDPRGHTCSVVYLARVGRAVRVLVVVDDAGGFEVDVAGVGEEGSCGEG